MSDPLQYETFGHMMFEHAPYIISGAAALIGMTLIVLRRLGLLIFSQEKADMKDCDKCGHKNTGQPVRLKCDGHQVLIDNFSSLKTAQNLMLQQQKTNMAELGNGKTEFKNIQARIADLRVGVGILLDRTGSIPDQFKDVFKDKR